jgi:maltooligosyltrehalose trehalohydrolase
MPSTSQEKTSINQYDNFRKIGAEYESGIGTRFIVWAPEADRVQVVVESPEPLELDMVKDEIGYWSVTSPRIAPGARYMFRLTDDKVRPDPASHSQPDGVHAASEVVGHSAYQWSDGAWRGMPIERMIIYELHVGTYSDAGTFQGVIDRLPDLVDLGITAIEIMPVAQFAGKRNWGYDGVYPFATQNSYGGPEGLKKLVDACHHSGIAVILDVVYNHMGPEGNYLNDFGPYFTEKYRTPWGAALNFDDEHSDHLRNFFFQNALMWLRDFHIDGLRLDAVHAILDTGAKHFLKELQEHVKVLSKETGREYVLIAESDQSDRRLLDPWDKGGFALDGQWMDDLHHSIHTLLTGEKDGYYMDFDRPEHLVQSLKRSFVYNGAYSPYRKRTVGSDATDLPAKHFVVCIQNHDQVGNRMLGERLTQLVPHDLLTVAAGMYLLSPYTPMLWMGEEYGEENPFLYFVSHTDKELLEAVRKGRREEFRSFAWKEEPPDPGAEETFQRSKLQHSFTRNVQQNALREFYKELIVLKRTAPAMMGASKEHLKAVFTNDDKVLHMVHSAQRPHLYALFNISDRPQDIALISDGARNWKMILDSSQQKTGRNSVLDMSTTTQERTIQLAPTSMIVLQEHQTE